MKIFCIRRDEGILPLVDFKSLFEGRDITVPSSKYVISSMMTREEEQEVSSTVLSGLEKRVNYYIQDKHYLWRLFASAGVFLILYLFMSLAIRDPLPLLDEILIAAVGSFITWILIAKHDTNARFAIKTKKDWHDSVVAADFEYSSTMGFVDEYIARLEKIDFKDIISMIADGNLPLYEDERVDGLDKAIESLLYYTRKLESKYIKQINKGNYDSAKMKKSLLQDYTLGNLDIYLLAFFLGYGRKSK